MSRSLRMRLAQEHRRDERRQARLAERPWIARRGIHGPHQFRTLSGAQGWADANWEGGEPEVKNGLTGECWKRVAGEWVWASRTLPKPEEPAEAEYVPPYWVHPL